MTDQQIPKKHKLEEFSAGIVLFREQDGKRKYLLLHYPSGHWDFAKGHLEAGESEMQAAIRELEEETGVSQVKVLDGFCEPIIYFFKRQGKLIKKTVTFFLGHTDSQEIKVSHEHQGYLWLDYPTSLAKITFENAREILRRSENFLQK